MAITACGIGSCVAIVDAHSRRGDMPAIPFERLEYSGALQEAGAPGEQAQAIVKASAKLLDMITAHDLVRKKI